MGFLPLPFTRDTSRADTSVAFEPIAGCCLPPEVRRDSECCFFFSTLRSTDIGKSIRPVPSCCVPSLPLSNVIGSEQSTMRTGRPRQERSKKAEEGKQAEKQKNTAQQGRRTHVIFLLICPILPSHLAQLSPIRT